MKYRSHVSKHGAAQKFRHQISRTKVANVRGMPMRGGIRL